MALTRKEFKPRIKRTTFTIVGEVLKTTESAFLLTRSNTQTQYWIDNNERQRLPKEGDIIECDVSISSYVSRKDSVFRHKIRFLDFRPLPAKPEREAITFFYRGLGDTEIVDIISSKEIETLHILKIKSLDTNEIFHVRYYQGMDEAPSIGAAKLTLNLTSLTSVMGTDGVAYENRYTAKWKDAEGKLVVKER